MNVAAHYYDSKQEITRNPSEPLHKLWGRELVIWTLALQVLMDPVEKTLHKALGNVQQP
jgi:hypothetical protein